MLSYKFSPMHHLARCGHLEPIEDLAFRRLVDLLVMTGKHIPARHSEAARVIRMSGYGGHVQGVLEEFFTEINLCL